MNYEAIFRSTLGKRSNRFDLETTRGRLNQSLTVWDMASPSNLKERMDSRAKRVRLEAKREAASFARFGYRVKITPRDLLQELYIFACLDQSWRLLPYGVWREADSSLVLFDREYCPIIRLHLDRPNRTVPPEEFIKFIDVRYFYNDSVSPTHDPHIEMDQFRLSFALGALPEIAVRIIATNKGDSSLHRRLKGRRFGSRR